MKEQLKRKYKVFRKKAAIICTAFFVTCAYANARCYAKPLAASTIANTTFAKGISKLISDLTTWLLIIIPVAGALFMLITFIKQMGESDEMDEKPHKKKNKSILLVIILAECITGIVNVLVNNYFKG